MALDFVISALMNHDRELTALGDTLKELIQSLKAKKLEKYESSMKLSEDLLKQISEVVSALRTLSIQRSETDALELKASSHLSRAQDKTFQALSYGKEMSISEVAKSTGRTRTIETIYLNHLSALGFVTKIKKGRKYHFSKKLLSQPIIQENDPQKVMILVLVSENASEEPGEIQDLVSRHLNTLKDWKLERSTILSKPSPVSNAK